jgi:CAAX protease family protein
MTDTTQNARLIACLELLVFVGFAWGSKLVVDQIIWKFSGPITLITTLVLLTIYMRYRGESWAGMGLRAVPGWKSKLLILPQALLTAIAIIATGAVMTLGGDALGFWSLEEEPSGVVDRFAGIEGNLTVYLTWMLVIWTSAAFGEEMFFRGFLITRFERVVAGIPFAIVIAIGLAALIFGAGHLYYQGIRGLVVIAAIGLVIGMFFLLYKRNLWPLILAHGLVDTLGMTARYLNLDV